MMKLFKRKKLTINDYNELINGYEKNVSKFFLKNYLIRDDDEPNICGDDEYRKIQTEYINDMKNRLPLMKKRKVENPYNYVLNSDNRKARMKKIISFLKNRLNKLRYYVKNYSKFKERKKIQKKRKHEMNNIKKLLHLRSDEQAYSFLNALDINKKLINRKF